MTRRTILFHIISIIGCIFTFATPVFAESELLTPQENLWLQNRNNTIVVYPEKNNPPFTYQSASGIIEGLSIDYIELIADKLDVTVQYLTPRSRSQTIAEAETGKGDIILTLASTTDREREFVFTDSYVTVPFVIVTRKDAPTRSGMTLADYAGKRLAATNMSVMEEYLRENYPRIVLEDVTDDEAGLQQVVLGQVEAAVMDVASLSYLLSKQVLSSVKVVGSVGYDYRPSFAMTKDKQILQSILEKGLMQVSAQERKAIAEKWIALPDGETAPGLFERLQSGSGILMLYVLFVLMLIGIIIALVRRRHRPAVRYDRQSPSEALHRELAELEEANKVLAKEIDDVKHLEEDIEQKLRRLNGQQ